MSQCLPTPFWAAADQAMPPTADVLHARWCGARYLVEALDTLLTPLQRQQAERVVAGLREPYEAARQAVPVRSCQCRLSELPSRVQAALDYA